MSKIIQFSGEHRYLSNFYDKAPFRLFGYAWRNSENAYQAMKSSDQDVWESMTDLSPFESKKIGKRIYLRHDWDEVKYRTMYLIVKAKFTQNRDIAEMLIATGDCLIEEGNTWGDVTWGISPPDTGTGTNWLGKILMEVREEL
jgi:hypothetical protein